MPDLLPLASLSSVRDAEHRETPGPVRLPTSTSRVPVREGRPTARRPVVDCRSSISTSRTAVPETVFAHSGMSDFGLIGNRARELIGGRGTATPAVRAGDQVRTDALVLRVGSCHGKGQCSDGNYGCVQYRCWYQRFSRARVLLEDGSGLDTGDSLDYLRHGHVYLLTVSIRLPSAQQEHHQLVRVFDLMIGPNRLTTVVASSRVR